MSEKNLFLIGYRGTGKTTIGMIVAKKLGKNFVDTDDLIVKIANKSIPKIFSEDGEEKFRKIETAALKKASEMENSVISCGGGIITKDRNFEILKKGVVCLLTLNKKEIYRRIYTDSNRPSLTDKDPMAEIEHLLEVRGPLYKKAADFTIKTDYLKKSEISEIIIKNYFGIIND